LLEGDVETTTWNIAKLLTEIEAVYQRESIHSYWPEESEPIKAALAAIANSITNERYTPLGVLGVGGSGIVLRLRDSRFPTVDNALKFPRPVPGKVEEVAGLLAQEITYLAKLRHRNIVRILNYRTLSEVKGYGDLPFYLMEAIDGSSSRQYLRNNPSDVNVTRVILDAAEVLLYLHSFEEGFAHLDIKPGNFVVDRDGRAVMIDLGTCKRLASDGAETTTIACTRSFAHPDLIRSLAKDPSDDNRAKGQVERSTIRPAWDLWSFGLTIFSWLGLHPQSGQQDYAQVLAAVSAYHRKYFFLLAARLLAGPYVHPWILEATGLSNHFLGLEKVANAEELCEALRRLAGTSNPIARVPELAAAQTNTVQAAPGVHVPVTEGLRSVLDHRLFRRLNSVSQLGLVSQIYPGAKHSRREHSLGTYANVQRMIKVLYEDQASPLFRQLVSVSDIKATLLASLLHDIGQFPLAHDLEEIDGQVFDHDDLTESMISGAWDKKKKGTRRIVFESLTSVFELWGVTADRVIAILSAKPARLEAKPKDKLLRSLFNGPIDADKLDYLLRDGRQLDLPYPRGIDTERIFGTLTTVVVDRLEGGAQDVPVLGVQAKGKVAAEFLTLARYAMFSQAYWHHAVRAQKAMLFRAIEALLASKASRWREFQTDFVELVVSLPEILYRSDAPRTLFGEVPVRSSPIQMMGRGADLPAADAAVLSWLHAQLQEAGLPEAKLLDQILRRQFFKRLWVVSKDMESTLWTRVVEKWSRLQTTQKHAVSHRFETRIADHLRSSGIPDVTLLRGTTASDRIDVAVRGREAWLLIDVPGQRPGSQVPLYYVLEGQRRALRKDNRSVGDLQASEVWEKYARDLIAVAGKVRVFCDPDLVDSVEVAMDWRTGVNELITAIEVVAT
jgi:HD superfamily phosphohydrolase